MEVPLTSYPLYNFTDPSILTGLHRHLAPYSRLAGPLRYDEYWKQLRFEEPFPDNNVPSFPSRVV